jgi:hypothetical protein
MSIRIKRGEQFDGMVIYSATGTWIGDTIRHGGKTHRNREQGDWVIRDQAGSDWVVSHRGWADTWWSKRPVVGDRIRYTIRHRQGSQIWTSDWGHIGPEQEDRGIIINDDHGMVTAYSRVTRSMSEAGGWTGKDGTEVFCGTLLDSEFAHDRRVWLAGYEPDSITQSLRQAMLAYWSGHDVLKHTPVRITHDLRFALDNTDEMDRVVFEADHPEIAPFLSYGRSLLAA